MVRLWFIVFVLLCAPALARAEDAAQPASLGTFDAFKAYRLEKAGVRSCYILTQPDKMSPANVRRDPVHLLITHQQKKVRNEISVQMGYPVKTDAQFALDIQGSGSFALAGLGQSAWIADVVKQDLLIEALRKAKEITIKGTSARGTATADHYSLAGFAKALDRIDQECPK